VSAAADPSTPGSIGARLKSLRSASGRSLEDLARELGVHFSTVSSWERGRSRPNYRTLSRLAAIYQVSPEYLLEEFGAGTPGRLVPGPGAARFRRIPERSREDLIGGLEEVRFLVMVRTILRERNLRLNRLAEATGISLGRLEAVVEGTARPTVSEVLHLADALGIRMEERVDTGRREEEPPPPTDPAVLLERLRPLEEPVRRRLVRLLGEALRLALPADAGGGPA
jgi:transcriptional regulator with XRE-family HTH domain